MGVHDRRKRWTLDGPSGWIIVALSEVGMDVYKKWRNQRVRDATDVRYICLISTAELWGSVYFKISFS